MGNSFVAGDVVMRKLSDMAKKEFNLTHSLPHFLLPYSPF
jgi:hypothetical protein